MKRNPVLLIHGIWDTIEVFNTMFNHLSKKGWEVHRINLTPNTGFARLESLALQVKNYIDQTFSHHDKIDLVGFSMGGLVTRYYLQRLQGINKVDRYINISAPNHGTIIAHGLPIGGISQMRPNSKFLKDLNKDAEEILSQIKFTWMWTPHDLMIIPAKSTCLKVGKGLQFPVKVHKWMISDKEVLNTLESLLLE